DGNGGFDTATVTLVVGDGEPCFNPDNICVAPETAIDLCIDFCTLNSSASIEEVNTTFEANIEILADNCISYQSLSGFLSNDIIQVTGCDNVGNCETILINISISENCGGVFIVANDDNALMNNDATQLEIDVMANDTHSNNEPFSITSFTQPAIGGTVALNDEGTAFIFTPTAGYTGVVTYTYTICDSNDICDEATVTIMISDVLCENQTFYCTGFMEEVIACVEFCNLGEGVEVTSAHTTFDCGLQIFDGQNEIGQNCIQYTPLPGFVGGDIIEIIGCDNTGLCDTILIEILVTEDCNGTDNQAPVANIDYISNEDCETICIDVMANDYDPNLNDEISITAFWPPTYGSVSIEGNLLCYTPNLEHPVDTFLYQICDNNLETPLCAEGMVIVTCPVEPTPCTGPQEVCAEPFVTTVVCPEFCEIDDLAGLTIESVTTMFNCSITLLENGCVEYTPLPGAFGQDSLVIVGCNAAGICDTSIVYSFIGCAAPMAYDDMATVAAGSTNDIDVLANDLGICNPLEDMIVIIDAEPQHGTATLNDINEVVYTADADYLGEDELTYIVCDPECPADALACDTATVNITIIAGDLVIAEPDIAQTPFNTDVTIDVLSNDIGVDLFINTYTQPTDGTVDVINIDGVDMFIFTPTPGFVGTTYFFYEVCSPTSGCDETIVAVTVLPEDAENLAPTANNDIAETTMNESVIIPVLANDSDPENGVLTIQDILEQPENGTAEIVDGTIVYTPNESFVGVDTFSYIVCDDATPSLCDTAIVAIAVGIGEFPNEYPIAVNDTASVTVGDNITINVLGNDSDPDGDELTVFIGSEPICGTVEIEANDEITYTPCTDNGTYTDYFTYIICDNGLPILCDTAYVSITVTDTIPQGPSAINDTVCVAMNGAVEIQVLENDTEPNGEELTLTFGTPQFGQLLADPDDVTVTAYLPPLEFTGIDTFFYVICDPNALCDTATVVINVLEEAIANPDAVFANENESIIIDVIANDEAVQGEVTSITEQPLNGTAELNNDGTVTYMPNDGFVGYDYFFYEVCDCAGNCDMTIAGINVLDENTENLPPLAGNDVAVTDINTPIEIDVLNNDTDPNGDPITITQIIEQPEDGDVTISDNGLTVIFTPNEDFEGCTIFAYEVCDDATSALCDTAYVAVGVGTAECLNQHPIAANDEATTTENTPVEICVLGNDTDPDGDDLTVNILIEPIGGTLEPTDTCHVFTPDEDFAGETYFIYEICDNGTPSLCDTAYVTINVVGALVDAQPDIAFTTEETPVEISVLDNDFGTGITVTALISEPVYGTVTGDLETGIAIYTPEEGFVGTDYFEYEICDATGDNCDITLVTVVVMPDTINNLPPNAVNDMAETPIDTQIEIDVLANDNDPFGGTTIIITDFDEETQFNGTVELNEDGTALIYTPDPDFIGIDVFTYVICDDFEDDVLCDTATVAISVGLGELPNQYPLAVDDAGIVVAGETISIDILENDIDPDGDELTVTFISEPCGTATLEDDFTVSYTTGEEDCGETDFFSYIICDDGTPALCDTAYVTITILPSDSLDAQPDIAFTSIDTPVQIDVLANDIGEEPVLIGIIVQPENGEVTTFTADGIVTYTPDNEFIGTDYFTYVICEAEDLDNCDTTLVTIIVLPDTVLNIAPNAVNDMATTEENVDVEIDALANDNDPFCEDGLEIIDFDAISVGNGTVELNAEGTGFIYTPDEDFIGTDEFSYTITDNCPDEPLTSTAIVVIAVGLGDENPNDFPVALEDHIDATCGATIEIYPMDNDTDPNEDEIMIIFISDPAGTAEWTLGDEFITYTTPEGEECDEEDFITYIICDDGTPMLCDTSYIFIHIAPQDTLIVQPDIATTAPETPVTIDVLANDTGNGLSEPQIVDEPNLGQIIVEGETEFVYQPNAGVSDTTDYFTYEVCDVYGNCETTLVTIIILPDTVLNVAPNAVNDMFIMECPTDTTETIEVNVLLNDNDPFCGDELIITSFEQPENGEVILASDSTFIYNPNGFEGIAVFTYTIFDNCEDGALSSEATVTINVCGGELSNTPPVAVDDEETTAPFASIIIDILENDYDEDGDNIEITFLSEPCGNVELNDDNTVTYTPGIGCDEIDYFSYVICDDGTPILCDTAYVTITISSNGPVAVTDSVTGTPNEVLTIDVLANDYDPDDIDNPDAVTLVGLDEMPTNGTASINPEDTTITYVPNQDFCGIDSFTYVIADAEGLTDTGLVVITIECDDFEAIDDFEETDNTEPIEIDVLANDIYDDSGVVTITIVSDPTNGTVTVNSDETQDVSVTYDPFDSFAEADTFLYELCVATEGGTICDTAQVIITINLPVECELVFAEGFSPNSDNINDTYQIENLDFIGECFSTIENIEPEMLIFNRWGDVVYRKVGYTNGDAWDGTWYTNGQDVADGTYFYILSLEPNNARLRYTGSIEVRR
ncbi:MAG: Ig-like domain-containing protein, partial [Chitinophagales bacterium]